MVFYEGKQYITVREIDLVHKILSYNGFKKAEKCKNKNCKYIAHRYERSLKAPFPYLPIPSFFQEMCPSCHRHYDLKRKSPRYKGNKHIYEVVCHIPTKVKKAGYCVKSNRLKEQTYLSEVVDNLCKQNILSSSPLQPPSYSL